MRSARIAEASDSHIEIRRERGCPVLIQAHRDDDLSIPEALLAADPAIQNHHQRARAELLHLKRYRPKISLRLATETYKSPAGVAATSGKVTSTIARGTTTRKFNA